MEINPVDTGVLIKEVSKGGELASFLLFAILILVTAIGVLWKRLTKTGDDYAKDLNSTSLSINNNTSSNERLIEAVKGLENEIDKLKDKVNEIIIEVKKNS